MDRLICDGRLVARRIRSPLLHRRRFEIQTMLDRTLPRAAEAFVSFLSEHIDSNLAALTTVLGSRADAGPLEAGEGI